MREKIFELYAYIFGREFFSKIHELLFMLSLRGMGILNYKNSTISGEKHFLKTYLKSKTGVVIDVGANVGNYTEMVLGINKSINVFAFEPHPITYDKLYKRFKDNKQVQVVNKGLSSREEVLELYDYSDKDGSAHASLFKDVITLIHGAKKLMAHKVSLITLDEFVSRENINDILLLKIDTEGNELETIKGAKELISSKKIPVIHFEFNEMNVVSKTFFVDFWNFLDKYGYSLYRLLPNGKIKINKYTPLKCEIFGYQNIVAILKK